MMGITTATLGIEDLEGNGWGLGTEVGRGE